MVREKKYREPWWQLPLLILPPIGLAMMIVQVNINVKAQREPCAECVARRAEEIVIPSRPEPETKRVRKSGVE